VCLSTACWCCDLWVVGKFNIRNLCGTSIPTAIATQGASQGWKHRWWFQCGNCSVSALPVELLLRTDIPGSALSFVRASVSGVCLCAAAPVLRIFFLHFCACTSFISWYSYLWSPDSLRCKSSLSLPWCDGSMSCKSNISFLVNRGMCCLRVLLYIHMACSTCYMIQPSKHD
jgi:hypothetical protein